MTVVIQVWDFRPGGNFVLDMQRAAVESRRTIAVLSETYLKSAFTQPEWAAAFVSDPQSIDRKLLPVKVKDCKPEGLLAPIVYVDLVGLSSEAAKQALLDSLVERAKPETSPDFPGAEVSVAGRERAIVEPKAVPSAFSRVQQVKRDGLQQQLDCGLSDYKALAKQRDFTTNMADRNALDRQLVAIAEDMEIAEAALDALGG
jgi:hypothetical protein